MLVVALELVLVTLLHLAPHEGIVRLLGRRLRVKNHLFRPTFSGRVGIWQLATQVARIAPTQVALCPDYICNVVPKALREAGWSVRFYPTDDRMEADWCDVLMCIEQHAASLLVGASIFGSSGLIDELVDASKVRFLESRGVHVLLDVCQDIRLLHRLRAIGSTHVHAVVSFNDKSFPGLMGGGVLTRLPWPVDAPNPCPSQHRRTLYITYLKKQTKRLLALFGHSPRPASQRPYDYSPCERFPYRISENNYTLTKLQVAVALVGVSLLPVYQSAKNNRLRTSGYKRTRFHRSAAFLLVEDASRFHHPWVRYKHPYARDEDPHSSLRPDDLVVHNKGFFDSVRR